MAGIGVGLLLSQLDDDNQAEEENPRLAVLRRTFMRYASTEKDGDKLMTLEDLFNCISPHLSISKENLKVRFRTKIQTYNILLRVISVYLSYKVIITYIHVLDITFRYR